MRRRSILGLAGLVAAALPLGCRDAVDPFRVDDRPPIEQQEWRLTFSSWDDRAPAWSADGDTVVYTASNFDGLPGAPAVPLALPADGEGPARTVLRNVQAGNQTALWVGAAALGPDGDRIAYVELRPTRAPLPCVTASGTCASLPGLSLPVVPLTSAVVRARAVDAGNPMTDDAALTITFAGHARFTDPTLPTGGFIESRYHTFQLEWVLERHLFFQPSWAPDGERLGVSDGMRLLVWRVGEAAATPIPGSDYGLDAEWSPAGDWIAYTRVVPTDSTVYTCQYFTSVPPPDPPLHDCDERRVHYQTAPAEVVLVRPDGSDLQVLVQGRDPTFSPAGDVIYFAGADGIRSVPVAGGASGFVGGRPSDREPAVAPDGERLAFTRWGATGTDVWVMQLP